MVRMLKFGRRKLSSLLFSFMFKTPVVEQNYLQRTEAFLADMKAQANPRDMYRYAREQIEEGSGEREPVSYLPGFVGWTGSKMPSYGFIEPNDGLTFVHLVWDRGGERWGLKVGPPEFVPDPESGDHYVEWAPGVYVWHELKKRTPPPQQVRS